MRIYERFLRMKTLKNIHIAVVGSGAVGNPMEIESIIGEPLRCGTRLRVKMPETKEFYCGLLSIFQKLCCVTGEIDEID